MFPVPRNVKDMRSFLGLTNYYSRFAREYSNECKPLIELTKKDKKWIWSPNEQKAFERVKELLLQEIELWHPDYSTKFYLQTDSSDYATGAHLYQKGNDGSIRTIAFSSKSMKPSELNYTTTEKELLAVIHAIRRFYEMIAGYQIILITDHKALLFLNSCKNPTQRIARWLLYLQPLNIEIEYIPGPENVIPDTLSRNPPDRDEAENFEKAFKISLIKLPHDTIDLLKNLHKIQQEDVQIKKYTNNIEEHQNYKLVNKIMYKLVGKRWLAVIPNHKIEQLIKSIHITYNHIGSNKCFRLISESFTGEKLRKKIKRMTKICDVCQKNKPSPTSKALTQFIDVDRKLKLLSIDYIGPFPTGSRGLKYILVCIDNFSKYVKLYPTQSPSTRQAIKAIEKYVSEVGKPESLLTDNGTAFTAKRWKEFMEDKNINHILTSIRHPQGNLSERTNRDVTIYLRILVGEKHNGWVKNISDIEKILNETYHSTLEMTPYEVQFNKLPERLWNQWLDQCVNTIESISEEQLRKLLNERLKEKGMQRAEKANKGKTQLKEFKVGDRVLIKSLNLSCKNKNRAAKLMPIFEGPFTITKKVQKFTYIVSSENKGKSIVRGMFHVSHLKQYYTENNY